MPVTVALVQLNHSFAGQSFLPYSVSLLQAYAQKHAKQPDRYRFAIPIFKRQPVSQIVNLLVEADIVGFSMYVWNARLSLEVARSLKRANPGVLVVFGGPHVPNDATSFLAEHNFIDIAIHGEGEQPFLKLLEQYPSTHWDCIEGASYVDPSGVVCRNSIGTRICDLEEIPSPILSGTYDALIAANPRDSWIGLWETNRGCPFTCTFCDWGSAVANRVHTFGLDRLQREIDWFCEKQIELIFCCDANFGILPRDAEVARYVARQKRIAGFPRGLFVQTTKTATESAYEAHEILVQAGLGRGVTLAIQSLNPLTLRYIRRGNISMDTYFALQRRYSAEGIDTYTDVILGLPGETYESFVEGVNTLIDKGQHNRIRFNNLSLLPNAEMSEVTYRNRHGIMTVQCQLIVLPGEGESHASSVRESHEVVVATNTMPLSDWRKARVFSWMAALLYFDRLLQLPLIIVREVAGISYRRTIEEIVNATGETALLAEIRDIFNAWAEAIQVGGPEYPFSDDWLGMYWTVDDYVFIKLTSDCKLHRFYDEVELILKRLLSRHGQMSAMPAVEDGLLLSRSLIKQPFVVEDICVETQYDVMGFYAAVLRGEKTTLRSRPMLTRIARSKAVYDDVQSWCREVVWFGKQRGEYFYEYSTYERRA